MQPPRAGRGRGRDRGPRGAEPGRRGPGQANRGRHGWAAARPAGSAAPPLLHHPSAFLSVLELKVPPHASRPGELLPFFFGPISFSSPLHESPPRPPLCGGLRLPFSRAPPPPLTLGSSFCRSLHISSTGSLPPSRSQTFAPTLSFLPRLPLPFPLRRRRGRPLGPVPLRCCPGAPSTPAWAFPSTSSLRLPRSVGP